MDIDAIWSSKAKARASRKEDSKVKVNLKVRASSIASQVDSREDSRAKAKAKVARVHLNFSSISLSKDIKEARAIQAALSQAFMVEVRVQVRRKVKAKVEGRFVIDVVKRVTSALNALQQCPLNVLMFKLELRQ